VIKEYFDQNLSYTKEELLDENGKNVMMEWERPIMKKAAFDLCSQGGDILNVGFGMGIIDNYIQSYPIKTHTIIEAHPDVQNKMIEDGWDKKPNVILIFSKWQDVIHYLPKFDGIYFDTWEDDQIPFDKMVPNLLKPQGKYSFFNNPTSHSEEYNYPYTPLQKYLQSPIPEHYIKGPRRPELFKQFNIDFHPIQVDPPKENGYFNPAKKTYWHPIFTFK